MLPRLPLFALGAAIALLAMDMLVGAAHMAWGLVPPGATATQSAWSLATNWGVGETYEYLKLAFCFGTMLLLFKATREFLFGFFAFIYLLTLADDVFKLHDVVGDALHSLGPDHVGQLIAFLAAGLLLLPLVLLAIRNASLQFVRSGIVLLGLFSLLACFSIGLDFVGTYTIVEDGGELVVLSLHTIYALHLVRKHAGGAVKPAQPGGESAGRSRDGSQTGMQTMPAFRAGSASSR